MKDKRSRSVSILYLAVLTVLAMLIFPWEVCAVPASPHPFELKQPSGKTFEARKRGDEWYNWVETMDGYGIYKNTETGYWEYYVPSDETPKKEQKFRIGRKQDAKKRAIVSEVDPAKLGIPKGLRPPRKEDGRIWKPAKPKTSPPITPHPSPLPQGERESTLLQEEGGRLGKADDSPLKRGAGVLDHPEKQPPSSPFSKGDTREFYAAKDSTSTAVSGTIPLVVIGVDFPDCPATYKPEEIQPLAFGSTNSVAHYYNDVSYSEVTIPPASESYGTANDGFVGWLRMNHNHPNNGFDIDVEEAILASDPYVNYASYDTDGDGYIEPTELSVMIIVAGYEAGTGGGSPSVWAHAAWTSGSFARVDGIIIQDYAMFGEKHGDHLATIGVMCHELGHLMFTLPDLYDTDYTSIGIGVFDLMGSGAWGAAYGKYGGSSPTHLSAWCKEYLGWGTVNTISSSQSISLPKVDGNKASIFRINTQDSNQYFLMENRQFSGYDMGFQRAIAGEDGHGGLVIYHIDKLKTDLWPDSNIVNDDESDKGVDVEEANEGSLGYSMLDIYESSADTNMFFFSGNNTSFTNDTTPDSMLKNDASTNVSVINVSTYGDMMPANISLPDHALYVLTDSATNLTTNSVKLNGIVNAMGLSAKAWFEYGTVTGLFNSKTPVQNISGMSDTAISTEISGLLPYTIYHYRLVAEAVEGVTRSGGNVEFTTLFTALTVSPRINAGFEHSLALKSESTVWAWGYNAYGELGDGTTINRNTPVQMNGLSGIIAITAGGENSFALRSDGTVWGCGENPCGNLGDGTTKDRTIPVQVKVINGITSISAGSLNCLALKSDGTVWSWGNNAFGKLGDGTDSNRGIPVQVKNISRIMAIASGANHNLALKSDGTVWTWGDNSVGQLGDGTYLSQSIPVQVKSLSGVIAIAGGGAWGHSLALKSDGTVWAWGNNSVGQLGDGTYLSQSIPVQVKSLSGIIALASGHSLHNLALRSDGTVWSWGYNYYGQLGDGTDDYNKYTPVQVIGLSDITAVAVGELAGHSLALKSDGTVWTWGYNKYGQLGDGTNENKSTPVQTKDINLGRTPVDNIQPAGSIEINNGDLYTISQAVTLSLSAVDTIGVTGYYISTGSATPSVSDQGWTSVSSTTFYSGTLSYTLNSGDGTKTVYAWYKDATGNISNKASDSIILDTAAPTVTITSPTSDSAYLTTNSTINLSGSASDSGRGISSVTWSNSKGGSGTASGTTSWSISSISLSSGENVITVTATDGAGYTGTDTITVTYSLCEAESMEMSTNRLVLRKGQSREVTISVKGTDDCPVEGAMVKADVLGEDFISISPLNQETDENGAAAFTITAKRSASGARPSVIFKTGRLVGNLEKTLRVKVKK